MLAIILFRVFSYPLSKNLQIKIYKTINVPVVLYGCETWSLSLWEEQRLKVCENGVLRRIFGLKRQEVVGGCIMRIFVTCKFHHILLG
jgi:hypothetical protein